MQMCMKHWNMLREEIDKLGMGDWITTDGETAMAQLVDQVDKGKHTITNFDPLMATYNMIMMRTLEMAGLQAMGNDFGCPICFFNSKRTEDGRCACNNPDCGGKAPGSIADFEGWLVDASAGTRDYMKEQGWLK